MEVKRHRPKLEDDNVQRGGEVRKEAGQRVLRRRRIERRVVDLVPAVRVALVDVFEHSHGKALERTNVWRAPAHEGGMDAIVAHAALVWLVQAAAILREEGIAEVQSHTWFCGTSNALYL